MALDPKIEYNIPPGREIAREYTLEHPEEVIEWLIENGHLDVKTLNV